MSYLYAPLLLVGIAVSTYYLQQKSAIPWLLAYLLGVNGVAFVTFVWDKLVAPLSKTSLFGWMRLRVPHWVLFWMLGLLGGGAGATTGIVVANHKTGDEFADYRNGLGLILLMQIGLLLWLLTLGRAALEPLNEFIASVVTEITELTQWVISQIRSLFA